jgi:hypothetical protein
MSYADENEILVGSLTHHLSLITSPPSDRFSNKLDSNGNLILNPMLGYRHTYYLDADQYVSNTIFGGENSIGEAMAGYAISTGLRFNRLQLGIIGGGYVQNDKKFLDRNITVMAIPLGSTYGIMPVIGAEVGLRQNVSNKTYLLLYTILTPALIATTLGVGFNF